MGELDVLFLSQEDVSAAGAMDMVSAVQDMEAVFRLIGEGDFVLPTKTVMRWGDADTEFTHGRINSMPGFVGGTIGMAGIKWIASFPANTQRGLPRGIGVIILSDANTGVPVAIMDGTLISAVRTAAATGVAVKHLARAGASRIGLIGAGVINRVHMLVLDAVLQPGPSNVKIYDLEMSRAEVFSTELSRDLGIQAEVVTNPQEAVRDMDIVLAATTSTTPIIEGDWLSEGILYCEIGGRGATSRALQAFDSLVVDNWKELVHRYSTQREEVGSLINLVENHVIRVPTELPEIVLTLSSGRSSDADRIMVQTVGMALQDVALATRIYRAAGESGLGTRLKWWDRPFST